MCGSRSREFNDAYAALLEHQGIRSTRINPGAEPWNGVYEKGLYRLHDAIDQALILLGSRDFDPAGPLRKLRWGGGAGTR